MLNTNFESYFNTSIKNDASSNFVILLGSGFHKNDSCNLPSLKSWDPLLKTIDSNFESTGNYLLDFEKIILKNPSNLTAQNQENVFLKKISGEIKAAEKLILKNSVLDYPTFIFNPNYVSDVISLNFDHVAEKLCRIQFKAKIKKRGYIKVDKKLGETALVHQTTKYKVLEFSNGKTITFWYPHGSVAKPTKMILGARRYGQHIACVERLRRYSKAKTAKTPNNYNWYDKLVHNPLLILGASISNNEWDLWSAIVNRERNFFKQKNIQYRNPIFQMRHNDCKKVENQSASQEWFEPLFNESLSFEKQWNNLKQLFK